MKMAFVKISLVLVAVLLGLYSASTYASSVTVWSADMEVVDYQNGAIGAPLASLFSNQGGTGGLTAVRLWYYGPARRLYLAFVSPVFNTAGLTLNAGDLVIAFQEDDSGDSSWTWEDVDAPRLDGRRDNTGASCEERVIGVCRCNRRVADRHRCGTAAASS